MARARLRRAWRTFVDRTGWTPPTTNEIATIGKAALAASLAWVVADVLTGVPDPVLAPLTALICVRVSVHASVRHALQRSAAVVLGVLVAVAIGNAIGLNALTVGLLTGGSLAVAVLLFRLPRQAANQVPVSVLVVMAALATHHATEGWERAVNAVIGAAVGAAVSLALPASRLKDARQTLERLGGTLGDVLEAMGGGLRQTWTSRETSEWRRKARAARDRLVADARDAIGIGRESAQWNIRDRRHVDELARYEQALPRLERTAIGVSSIARGLDDDAHAVPEAELPPMKAMSGLLDALGELVRAVVRNVLTDATERDVELALTEVEVRREPCAQAASRRARRVLVEDVDSPVDRAGLQWLSYAALLVQVDRIVDDLRATAGPPS
jgi:uncharacterized membrane protein YgaE (UPF0421/DUF939 family)